MYLTVLRLTIIHKKCHDLSKLHTKSKNCIGILLQILALLPVFKILMNQSSDHSLDACLISNPCFQESDTNCSPKGRNCFAELEKITCRVDCEGLHADVDFDNSTKIENEEDNLVLENLIQAYNAFKGKYVESLVLDNPYKSNWYKTERKGYHPLQVVQIYFSTATYDKIENDVSVTLGDQVSAIGGTMGLFAGFSILSAVEVIYFVMKFLFAFLSRRMQSTCCCRNA